MKENNYNNIGNCYFKKAGNNFMIVKYSIYNSMLYSEIEYKKYSYDDIFWRIIGKPELSKKSDSERVFGAFHIIPTKYKNITDNCIGQSNCLETIKARIHMVVSEEYEAISQIDMNEIVIKGHFSNKQKSLALIDMDNIYSAVQLAKNCCYSGDDGGIIFNGKTFFQLLIELYSTGQIADVNNVNTFQKYEMKGECEMKSIIIDDVNWQIESVTEWYCEDNNIPEDQLSNKQKRQIELYAANMPGVFFFWMLSRELVDNRLIETQFQNVNAVRTGELSGAEFVIDVLDGKLTREDVKANEYEQIYNYYTMQYMNDYFDFLDKKRLPTMAVVFSYNTCNEFNQYLDAMFNKWIVYCRDKR